jgi:hypothetical protein
MLFRARAVSLAYSVTHHTSVKCRRKDVSDSDATELLMQEFASNFLLPTDVWACVSANMSKESLLQINCSEQLVAEALKSCPNSNACPDGMSFRILKMFSHLLVRPLNIVFQQSLYTGTFPAVWKHSVILPLYKGRGQRSSPSSYRPISLCSCLGKLLEKLVNKQLMAYLKDNNIINKAQHGFMTGKSTITNLLSCDAAIGEMLTSGHAFDIISLDFKAAFDKAPHRFVVEALADCGVSSRVLSWFASYLSDRTAQVKIGDSYSTTCKVLSGVIQGSVCGPALYNILANTLLHIIRLPCWCFADDIKILADVTTHNHHEIQEVLDGIATWTMVRQMALTIDKCGVLHGGRNQPNHRYHIHSSPMPSLTSFKDLGVLRSADGLYNEQCAAVVSKANKQLVPSNGFSNQDRLNSCGQHFGHTYCQF